jgi:hypothetical protein
LLSSNATPALDLSGADYVTFDSIDITLTINGKVVQITNNADYNTIKNCTLTGMGETSSSNYGAYTTGGGNDYNVIQNVTVNRTVYYPVYLAGFRAAPIRAMRCATARSPEAGTSCICTTRTGRR